MNFFGQNLKRVCVSEETPYSRGVTQAGLKRLTMRPEEDIGTEAGYRVIVNVGMGEMEISSRLEVILTTYSLGSCVGVTLYDPVLQVGGMIHCMLPLSKADIRKSTDRPEMYVDTGMGLLLQSMFNHGAIRDRLIVKVAGASRILDQGGYFKIGERNYAILRKVLWKNNLLIASEEVGGAIPRTMSLEIATGRTWIRTGDELREI